MFSLQGETGKDEDAASIIHILHINMNRSEIAHELLAPFAAEVEADVVLFSEKSGTRTQLRRISAY